LRVKIGEGHTPLPPRSQRMPKDYFVTAAEGRLRGLQWLRRREEPPAAWYALELALAALGELQPRAGDEILDG
jgi:hypothetical protein